MSTLLDASPTPRAAVRTHARRSAVWALARVEGFRLLRNPIVVFGVLMSSALYVVVTWNEAPVLHRDDIWTGLALLPLAATTFLAANLASLRSRRHGTEELYEAAGTAASARTLGLLLAEAWPVGLALVLAVAFMVYLVVAGAVGSPSLLELLVGPATVALGGALGVALARWWPMPIAGPVGLIAMLAMHVLVSLQLPAKTPDGRGRWLAPWVPMSVDGDPPRELVIRPSGWHLTYLAALVVGVGVLAMLRHGVRLRPVVTGIVAGTLIIAAASAQLLPPSQTGRQALVPMVEHPERHLICRPIQGVRYCAYPTYVPWIDRWAAAVNPVLSRVPADSRPTLEIRQSLVRNSFGSDLPDSVEARLVEDSLTPPEPNVVLTTARWGRHAEEGGWQFALALITASRIMSLPQHYSELALTEDDIDIIAASFPPNERDSFRRDVRVGDNWGQCHMVGQARAVVAIWLAAQATRGAERAFRQNVKDQLPAIVTYEPGPQDVTYSYHGMFVYGLGGYPYPFSDDTVLWPRAEVSYALRLLGRPKEEVARTLAANWKRLARPDAKTDVLLDLFGLARLPTLEEQANQAGIEDAEISEARELQGMIPCR